MQYRKLVDDLGKQGVRQEERVAKATQPWQTAISAASGGLVAALMTLWFMGPGGAWLRQRLGIEATSYQPASYDPAVGGARPSARQPR